MKAYPTYKDSGVPWLGEIPEHWGISQYRAYFQERNSPNKNLQETNLLSISYGKIIQKDINKTEGLLPASFESYNIIEDGDIVLRLTDLQNDHKSLRTALCTQKGIITSAYVTLQPINQTVNSAYFQYQLHIYDVRKAIYGAGGGVRQALNYDAIVRLKSCVPSVEEQNAIVAYLDKKCTEIDELVSRRQSIIERLKELKQAIIANAVTKGLNSDVPLKDSGIQWMNHIPEHWQVLSLKYVAKLSDETLSENTDPNFEFDYVDISSVTQDKGITQKERYRFKNAPSRARRIVHAGDVIISTVRTYLRAIAVIGKEDEGAIVSTGFAVFRSKQSRFFAYALSGYYFVSRVSAMSTGVSYPAITAAKLKRLHLALPPEREQNIIVAYLDKKCAEIDELVSRQEQIIEKLKELKTSTIAHVVTGKVDVRESI